MSTGIYLRTKHHRIINSNSHKGLKHSEKTKKKISNALKGRIIDKKWRENLSKSLKGHKHSEKTKEKIGLSHLGIKRPDISKLFKGKKRSIETKQKLSGENSCHWKGDKASYEAKHMWISDHYGKAKRCEFDFSHKASYYHWANITGKYTRDKKDYMQLCPACHSRLDRYRRLWKKHIIEVLPKENDGIPTTDLAKGIQEGYNLYRQEALRAIDKME